MNNPQRRKLLDEYRQLAPTYDKRWADYIDASIELTLEQFPSQMGGRVLDVGCGTGRLLQDIQQRNASTELFGIDISDAMLALAREKIGATATLITADLTQLPFADSYFDAIVSSSVLHYLENQQQGIAEMARVLRPGGSIVITDWCKDFLSMRVLDQWLVVTGKVSGNMLRDAELQSLLAQAGFQQLHSMQRRVSPIWGLMVCRGYKTGS